MVLALPGDETDGGVEGDGGEGGGRPREEQGEASREICRRE